MSLEALQLSAFNIFCAQQQPFQLCQFQVPLHVTSVHLYNCDGQEEDPENKVVFCVNINFNYLTCTVHYFMDIVWLQSTGHSGKNVWLISGLKNGGLLVQEYTNFLTSNPLIDFKIDFKAGS